MHKKIQNNKRPNPTLIRAFVILLYNNVDLILFHFQIHLATCQDIQKTLPKHFVLCHLVGNRSRQFFGHCNHIRTFALFDDWTDIIEIHKYVKQSITVSKPKIETDISELRGSDSSR